MAFIPPLIKDFNIQPWAFAFIIFLVISMGILMLFGMIMILFSVFLKNKKLEEIAEYFLISSGFLLILLPLFFIFSVFLDFAGWILTLLFFLTLGLICFFGIKLAFFETCKLFRIVLWSSLTIVSLLLMIASFGIMVL